MTAEERPYGIWLASLGLGAIGEWLCTFDLEAGHEVGAPVRGFVTATPDPALALRFATAAEALAFTMQQSQTMPLRPDGRPNRPLTAFTVLIERLPDVAPAPEGVTVEVPHTGICLAAIERFEAWRALWPDYCTTCGAVGAIEWMEDVAGDGGSRMPMADACGCMESNLCPRCGIRGTLYEDDDLEFHPCSACGWTGRGRTDITPYDPRADYLCLCVDPQLVGLGLG